jgi:hypothetical protein
MAIERYKPEQIVTLLRQIEVGTANGKTTPPGLQRGGDHGTDVLSPHLFFRLQTVIFLPSCTTQPFGELSSRPKLAWPYNTTLR